MTYRGHVKQGVIVLDSSAQLPEGTEVEVWACDEMPANDSWAPENSLPREALRQLQQEARLTQRQAEAYLCELRAERLAAETHRTA
jgi:hypothetical protein